jgi:cell wall assembly regulator SMI1
MNYLDTIEEEMKASGGDPVFVGGAQDSHIKAFENELGVRFPPSYKEFLKRFGALSFAGDTYYGITKKGLTATSVPSVAFATKSARSQGDADSAMVVVKVSGYGPIYSIDTAIIGDDGESPIIETELSFKREAKKTVVAKSFGDFIARSIQDAIKEL